MTYGSCMIFGGGIVQVLIYKVHIKLELVSNGTNLFDNRDVLFIYFECIGINWCYFILLPLFD